MSILQTPRYVLPIDVYKRQESVLEYTENPSVLKAQRPQTYEAITNALSKVTDAQVNKIMNVYKVIWK